MRERLNRPRWKRGVPSQEPGVRIPFSPPLFIQKIVQKFLFGFDFVNFYRSKRDNFIFNKKGKPTSITKMMVLTWNSDLKLG